MAHTQKLTAVMVTVFLAAGTLPVAAADVEVKGTVDKVHNGIVFLKEGAGRRGFAVVDSSILSGVTRDTLADLAGKEVAIRYDDAKMPPIARSLELSAKSASKRSEK